MRKTPSTVVALVAVVLLVFLVMRSHTPNVRRVSRSPAQADQIRNYKMNSLVTTSRPLENREKILILTPMARFYPEYWDNLLRLDYPKELVELGFIVPRNKLGDAALKHLDAVTKRQQTLANKAQHYAKITILRQDTESPESQHEKDRHAMAAQKRRRAQMSLARNSLLFSTIGPDTSWILWLDADIVETPKTLVQDLASHDKAVTVANCFQRYLDPEKGPSIRPYDYNSWQDSEDAAKLAADIGEDDILLEGYAEMATYRTLMAKLYDPNGDRNAEIPLDGVGATALLVKAEVHRDGAMFPPFAFHHLIESEGFGKMARRLGYALFGLPNYLVFHYNE